MYFYQFPQTIVCQEMEIFVKVNVYLVYACICVYSDEVKLILV